MTNTEIIKQWFTNKNEYLIWRTAWKAEYAELTKNIREYKLERRINPDPTMKAHAQYQCFALRAEATKALELRKRSKEEAQRQYLVNRSAQTSPCPADCSLP